MISRRSLLAWLGLAPFAIAAMKLPAMAETEIYSLDTVTGTRQRWKTVLNPDGSSDFVKGDKRFLEAWVEAQKPDVLEEKVFPTRWNDCGEHPNGVSIGDLIKRNTAVEKQRIQDRSNPYKELKEFEAETGIDVPIEAKVYDPGQYFVQDLGGDPQENVRRWEAEGLKDKYGTIEPSWCSEDGYTASGFKRDRRRCGHGSIEQVKVADRPPRADTPCFSQIIEEYTTPDGRFLAAAG